MKLNDPATGQGDPAKWIWRLYPDQNMVSVRTEDKYLWSQKWLKEALVGGLTAVTGAQAELANEAPGAKVEGGSASRAGKRGTATGPRSRLICHEAHSYVFAGRRIVCRCRYLVEAMTWLLWQHHQLPSCGPEALDCSPLAQRRAAGGAARNCSRDDRMNPPRVRTSRTRCFSQDAPPQPGAPQQRMMTLGKIANLAELKKKVKDFQELIKRDMRERLGTYLSEVEQEQKNEPGLGTNADELRVVIEVPEEQQGEDAKDKRKLLAEWSFQKDKTYKYDDVKKMLRAVSDRATGPVEIEKYLRAFRPPLEHPPEGYADGSFFGEGNSDQVAEIQKIIQRENEIPEAFWKNQMRVVAAEKFLEEHGGEFLEQHGTVESSALPSSGAAPPRSGGRKGSSFVGGSWTKNWKVPNLKIPGWNKGSPKAAPALAKDSPDGGEESPKGRILEVTFPATGLGGKSKEEEVRFRLLGSDPSLPDDDRDLVDMRMLNFAEEFMKVLKKGKTGDQLRVYPVPPPPDDADAETLEKAQADQDVVDHVVLLGRMVRSSSRR